MVYVPGKFPLTNMGTEGTRAAKRKCRGKRHRIAQTWPMGRAEREATHAFYRSFRTKRSRSAVQLHHLSKGIISFVGGAVGCSCENSARETEKAFMVINLVKMQFSESTHL